jgi:hypothetical protein
MLRITVELVPHGIEAQACEIAHMIIANTGGGTSDYGYYEYSLHSQPFGTAAGVDYGGSISNYPRQQPVLALCRAVLNDWWDDHGRLQASPPFQQPIRMTALLDENGAVAEYHQGAWRAVRSRSPVDCWWVLHSGFPRDRWVGLDEEPARRKLLALIKQGQPEAATDKTDR